MTKQEHILILQLELARERAHNKLMREGWIRRDYLLEKLDEAMASKDQIKSDTECVGGFVSGLNLTATDEGIINRAIKIIEKSKRSKERWRGLKRLFLKCFGTFLWQLSYDFHNKMEDLRPAGGFKEL